MRLITGFVCFVFCNPIFSQIAERKIIIQNNSFFYTTIHDEFQIATLNTGNFAEPLKSAKKLALPAGRNYNEPVNPFSWDITDSLMYAISFLNHPLNSKNDALKCFKLSSLQEWSDSVTVMDMIMKSVDQNRFAYNEPYKFMMHQSNYLNGFYFDGIVLPDSSYEMVIVNNNQLNIWNFANNKWTHSETQTFIIDGFFSLFEVSGQLYMILNNGNVHKVLKEQIQQAPDVVTNKSLKENILILNRDKNTIQLIKNNDLNMHLPFKELIEKKGISIF